MLPDRLYGDVRTAPTVGSQCTYRCVVLPDKERIVDPQVIVLVSQCTYRCVVLPDVQSLETRHQ